MKYNSASLLSRDETDHLGSHQPGPRIAAGCRNTGNVWGEGPLGPGAGPPVWYWQPERMCLAGAWKRAGGRETGEGTARGKSPQQHPPQTFFQVINFFVDI